MRIEISELVSLLGEKDVEIYALKKELAQTRAVLEQVTRGDEDGKPAEEATDGSGGSEATDNNEGFDNPSV